MSERELAPVLPQSAMAMLMYSCQSWAEGTLRNSRESSGLRYKGETGGPQGTQSISDGANISMRTGPRVTRRKPCPEGTRWDQCLCIPVPEALSRVQRSPGWGGLAVLQAQSSRNLTV